MADKRREPDPKIRLYWMRADIRAMLEILKRLEQRLEEHERE